MFLKNTIIKIISLFSLSMLCLNMSGCNKTEPQPMLKVETSTSLGGIATIAGTDYYIVYDNSKVEKTSEFKRSTIEHYSFSSEDEGIAIEDIDINTEQGTKISEIGKNIISLSKKDKKIKNHVTMYVIDNKNYFTVWLKKGLIFSYEGLYEYNEADNSIKRIAEFKGSIMQVEPYQNSD